MKKLLKVLTVFVVMFGFSGMVMAYDKPNGKFYTGVFGSTGEDDFDLLNECVRSSDDPNICQANANKFSETLYLLSDEYLNKTTNARKVIDYMSGMTDDYFINRYNEIANIKVKR